MSSSRAFPLVVPEELALIMMQWLFMEVGCHELDLVGRLMIHSTSAGSPADVLASITGKLDPVIA